MRDDWKWEKKENIQKMRKEWIGEEKGQLAKKMRDDWKGEEKGELAKKKKKEKWLKRRGQE